MLIEHRLLLYKMVSLVLLFRVNHSLKQFSCTIPVMWSETVGLKTRPVTDEEIGFGFGLAGLVFRVVL